MFQNAVSHAQGQSTIAFDGLYLSMNEHTSFKKQIKLDHLCMISNLKIAGIEPGQFYFSDVLPLKKPPGNYLAAILQQKYRYLNCMN